MPAPFTRLLPLCLAPLCLAGCATPPRAGFSPDGRRVVVPWGPKDALYVADASSVVRLKDTEGAGTPVWSPDGRSIAFLRGGELCTHDLARGETVSLASDVSGPLAWSGDGAYLVGASRSEDGPPQLCWFDRPAGPARVVPLPVDSISPDAPLLPLPGSEDVALLAEDQDGSNAYVVRSGPVRRVTTTGDVVGLGLSRDGARLLWARSAAPFPLTGLTLWTQDLRTLATNRLPFAPRLPAPKKGESLPEAHRVLFSPDGSRLAIEAYGDDRYPLYVANLSGTGLRLVDHIPPPAPGPADEDAAPPAGLLATWSPDGRRLAVVRTGPSPAVRIYSSDTVEELPLPGEPQGSESEDE